MKKIAVLVVMLTMMFAASIASAEYDGPFYDFVPDGDGDECLSIDDGFFPGAVISGTLSFSYDGGELLRFWEVFNGETFLFQFETFGAFSGEFDTFFYIPFDSFDVEYPATARTTIEVVTDKIVYSLTIIVTCDTPTGTPEVTVLRWFDGAVFCNGDAPSFVSGGRVVAPADLYWNTSEDANTGVFMAPGSSVLVYGIDSSGSYWRVLYACEFYWMPVDSLGPNFDEVWNGKPLPGDNVID